MKRKLPKHCTRQRNRHGALYIRFRRGDFSHYFKSKPGTEEFEAEYADCLKGIAQPMENERVRAGSMKSLILRYYTSPEFRGLAESTQRTYRGILNRFIEVHGDKRVRHLERRHIKNIIGDMSGRKQAANNLLNLLKVVLDLGVDIDMISANPARGIKGYPSKTPGFHTWTEEEIALFMDCHPCGTRARLAIMLLLYTAQRRGDVVCMGRQHVKDGRIRIIQQKTKALVDIPLHPELDKEIKRSGGEMTFLMTSHGKPFTAAGFGNWFRECCNQAGLKSCSAHGLRKAASRRLAESGKTPNQIGAVTGHTTLTEVERYTREADRAGLADDAFDASKWTEEEQELPTLGNRVGKKR